MKKKERSRPDSSSLKTAFIYAGVVFCIIIIALFIKLVLVIRESTYDGQHRFNIAFRESNNKAEIVSFEKISGSISILTIQSTKSLWPLWEHVSIIPDGIIDDKFDASSSLARTLFKNIFLVSKEKNHLTSFDMFRLFLFSKTIPSSKMTVESLSPPTQLNSKKLIIPLSDTTLIQENVSVGVMNGSGITGEGGRLDQIISLSGGNVISIGSEDKIIPESQIIYSGKKTYTVSRLASLLHLNAKLSTRRGVSDILVILGKGGLHSLLEDN